MTQGTEPVDILVVCTANICRSPLVAAMLAAEATARLGADASVRVRSAGLQALAGHGAASGSQAMARQRGLDLGGHRAGAVTRQGIEDADLVLTMTTRHREAVNALAPGSRARVFTLREFARLAAAIGPSDERLPPRDRVRSLVSRAHGARAYVARAAEPEDVADPYGGPDEGYVRMALEVEGLVRDLAPRLFGSETVQG